MENYLTQDKVRAIVNNAPKGSKPEDVINGLVKRGYKLEGFNDQPEPVAVKTMTGLDKAPFQATGEENLLTGTAKAIGNTPRSATELTKNVVSAVINPVDTAKSLFNIAKGAGAKLGETVLENTDFGQKFLSKANESRISKGLEPLQKDATGKFQVANTPELEQLNKVGELISDRYGSMDKFQETLIEDPVGVLADVSTVLTGGSAVLSKAGQVSKISELSNIANKVNKLAQATEPINAVTKTLSNTKKAVGNSTVGNIISDVVPTGKDIQRSQVTKALDLTQGDLVNITKKTGNDPTDFIVKNKLIKESPEATAQALNDFRAEAKATKASEIANIKNIYTPEQVPSMIKGLDSILDDIDGVAGLEDDVAKIKDLKSKTQFTLEDIQNGQYILDENSNIYSKIGDTKSGSKAKGLDKIRKDTRKFIEDEVTAATNGNTNIKKINNDIQTSFTLEDAINTRETRNLTRQKLSLSDSVVLFGGGATFNPAIGIGLYLGKKIIETPTFRLAFVKALNAQPVKNIKRIVTEVKNKNVSPETQKIINQIADEARKNLQVVESGSAILGKSKSEKQK